MKRFALALVLSVIPLLMLGGPGFAKGEPRGAQVKDWPCILDGPAEATVLTWHCVQPGVLKNFGLPSLPSLNWECDDPGDPLCARANFPAVSFGPPSGTHFVGTENGIRVDLYAGQPCPTDTPVSADVTGDGVDDYVFCHHYASG